MKPRFFGLLPSICLFLAADTATAGGSATNEASHSAGEDTGATKADAPKAGVFERAKAYLKGRGELAEDLNVQKAKVSALEAEVAEKDKTISEQNAELVELRAGRDQLSAEVERLENSAKTVDQAASGKMKEAMAGIGVPASELPPSAESVMDLKMSKAEFDKMTPAKKMEFSRKGGRLTE